MRYRSADGDVLDAICLAHYGHADAVEAVLDANPGLAGKGTVLAAGTVMTLPDLPQPARSLQTVRLWD